MTVTHSKMLKTRRKRQAASKRLAREAKKADRAQKQNAKSAAAGTPAKAPAQ